MEGAEEPELRLVLARHGETEWTELGRLHGRLDSPLSPTGRRHAERTAERLRGETFDALYASPLGRAMRTAQLFGEALGLEPIPLDGLREMDFGWTEGQPLRLVDPDFTGAWMFRPLVGLAMRLSGERPERFAARIAEALEGLRARHPGGRVLAVTHWAVLSMLLAQVVDGDLRGWRENGPWAACGLSELHAVDGAWRVVYLNDHSHLKTEQAKEN